MKVSTRLGLVVLLLEICKRWGHNSYKMTSKWCGKNYSPLSKFFQLVKLTQNSKILKIEQNFFWKFFPKWNYYTNLNTKWSLLENFCHFPLFLGILKKWSISCQNRSKSNSDLSISLKIFLWVPLGDTVKKYRNFDLNSSCGEEGGDGLYSFRIIAIFYPTAQLRKLIFRDFNPSSSHHLRKL